ncbi:mitochondrial ribosomal protein subunit L20-domain-containing protein [Fimicolochytrium jonesii]|uniref:mitochondrial ribosomal protein subunit L20-domain-containing protein n=1 Tax=Fimicolochytrium jonesii TaxID=1396493 RepID=UPI0022FDC874|nr:mitochondrial ribosomal protein subunit L20-domain-containing protein [Fimicolochytrium jonesii]KAI8815926.1 mitochondrial ribosomal protein subunit L20-domain-containing protein [Fimicolochytrium jonesii]
MFRTRTVCIQRAASVLPTTTSTILPRSAKYPTISALRTFYSWNVPADTPRTTLDDGSVLIQRHHKAPAPQVLPASTLNNLPPALRPPHPASSTEITAAQLAELQKLRREDPDTWTVTQLARKFNVPPALVMREAKCPPARKRMIVATERERFERMSIARKVRAVDRIRRKALW